MRIIGGKHRGRTLASFKGDAVRPTSDRAREALFNILQFKIVGASFYDAFCGSGSVAAEAISRGAKEVVLTDSARESVELAKKNLKLIGESAQVELTDAVSFLKRTSLKFDVIFLDPPYSSTAAADALRVIAERNILQSGGVVVYEHRAGDKSAENQLIEGLILYDTRKYGVAQFDFYRSGL